MLKFFSFQHVQIFFWLFALSQLSHQAFANREKYLRQRNESCDGAPYLYVTFHDKFPNIFKYSRNGCLLQTDVLIGGPIFKRHRYTELRSMTIGTYQGEEALYLADAKSKDSYLLLYSKCNDEGKRTFIKSIAATHDTAGVDHTYGICFDQKGNIYASFQHTDCVLRFKKDTFELMPFPLAIKNENKWWKYFPGTFYQFGEANDHSTSEQGIRSIALVNDDIWIANENIGGVAIVTIETGLMNNIVIIPNPIGLYYDKHHNIVFVSSKMKHWQGAVYGIDVNKLRIIFKYTTNRMDHPSGIVTYGDELFVAEQVLGEIYKFNIHTEKYLGIVAQWLPREIEQLTLSNC